MPDPPTQPLVFRNLVSLDGHFDGPDGWDLDWHDGVVDDAFDRITAGLFAEAGGLVFGRVTYEGMAEYWPGASGPVADLMNGLPKVVASRTLEAPAWSNTTVVRDAVAEIPAVKARAEGPLYVLGSGTLGRALLRAGLVDEVHLGVVPVVLGRGRPLFGEEGLDLDLLGSRPLPSGLVISRYAPRRPDAL